MKKLSTYCDICHKEIKGEVYTPQLKVTKYKEGIRLTYYAGGGLWEDLETCSKKCFSSLFK
jgi:hypothetical protein